MGDEHFERVWEDSEPVPKYGVAFQHHHCTSFPCSECGAGMSCQTLGEAIDELEENDSFRVEIPTKAYVDNQVHKAVMTNLILDVVFVAIMFAICLLFLGGK